MQVYNPTPMMVLSTLAATAATERPSGETQERRENRMMSGINHLLKRYQPSWTAVWAAISKDGANFAYIASSVTGDLAVVVRGTIFTPIDLLEDLDVGSLVQFTAIPPGFSDGPVLVSQGAMQAFTEIMTMVSVAKGTNLGQELAAQQSSGDQIIFVTGHSLGGCIASMVALYLAIGYYTAPTTSIQAYTFAAPTAGTQAFAESYDTYVTNGPHNNAAWRVYNTYDVVPNAWQTLSNVENYYPSPGPTANDTVSGLISSFVQSTNDNPYTQTNQIGNAMALNGDYQAYDSSQLCESVGDFLGQMAFQHSNANYLGLLAYGEIYEITAPGPSISGITPNTGPMTGGTVVTLTGSNFLDSSEVDFGTMPAALVNRVSDTVIEATAPAGIGVCDIRVTTITGTSPSTPADQFAFLSDLGFAGPAVTGVGPFLTTGLLPNGGPAGGGNRVTITGTGFVSDCLVAFGSGAATDVTIVSLTEITATAPAGSGTVQVVVSNPSDQSSATSSQSAYTYGAPLVTGLAPCCGMVDKETPITIIGAGFQSGSPVTVQFGTKKPIPVTPSSDTEINVSTPISSDQLQNTVPVVVTVGGVSCGLTEACIFTYTSGL